VKHVRAELPMGFGDIDGVVQTTLFLCSADARYITGQVLNVNGGFHM
jgi:NAD(P)-dependent dehydrogenase (short-subunit alcohol dehydrogenase family)